MSASTAGDRLVSPVRNPFPGYNPSAQLWDVTAADLWNSLFPDSWGTLREARRVMQAPPSMALHKRQYLDNPAASHLNTE